MFNLFVKKDTKSRKYDYLNEDIKKLDNYFKNSKTLATKQQIRDKALFIRLKKKALNSKYDFIKNAEKMLFSEEREDIYLAIGYIKEQQKSELSSSALLEIELFSALLYELVEKNTEAKNAYLKAIKHDKTSNAFKEYKEFNERLNELKNYTYETVSSNDSIDFNKTTNLNNMLNNAQKIESIAKNYTKSKKSLHLAQKYFAQSLNIYKQLSNYNPKKYLYHYILSLIKSVEMYKMDRSMLNEAEALIFHSSECQKTEQYLLSKIQLLKKS